MKKLLLFAAIFCTYSLSAQDSGFGIRIGVNYSTLTSNAIDDKFKLGLHGGGYYKFNVTDFFNIQPEVLYTQKGSSFKSSDKPAYFNPANNQFYTHAKATSSYIEVPVFARINVTEDFHFLAGPHISVLVGHYTKFNNGSKDTKDTYSGLEGNNRIDYGITGGLGYDIGGKLNVGIRGSYGFNSLKVLGENVKNTVIQATIGFNFWNRSY